MGVLVVERTVPDLRSRGHLLLLVWQAPLGVRSAKRRHQSPEWTILSHSYRLVQGEIVRPQVLLDSLHPCSSRTFWWSPVLRRGSSYDTPGICLVWHSCNVAEQRKTPCLDNNRQALLPGCPRSPVRIYPVATVYQRQLVLSLRGRFIVPAEK